MPALTNLGTAPKLPIKALVTAPSTLSPIIVVVVISPIPNAVPLGQLFVALFIGIEIKQTGTGGIYRINVADDTAL